MRRLVLVTVLASVLFLVPSLPAAAGDKGPDIAAIPACKYCGMDREKYASSRMLVSYSEGEPTGTCSIHCLAVDLALNIDRAPLALQVGDHGTLALTNAEKATWVIVDDKPGVMTRRAKWAFADPAAAKAFIAANGGRVAGGGFDEALQASFEDMGADVKAIRERRAAKRKAAAEAAGKP